MIKLAFTLAKVQLILEATIPMNLPFILETFVT